MTVLVLRVAGTMMLLALIGFSAVSYGELPERIPGHFDLSGAPTRFDETSFWSWFAPPAIAAAMWGLLAFLGSRLPSNPDLFNFPQKDRFLALPPVHRRPVIEEMQAFLALTSVLVTALFLVIQLMVWRVAMQGSAGALAQVPLIGVVLLVLAMLLWLPRLKRAVEVAERRVQAEARGAT